MGTGTGEQLGSEERPLAEPWQLPLKERKEEAGLAGPHPCCLWQNQRSHRECSGQSQQKTGMELNVLPARSLSPELGLGSLSRAQQSGLELCIGVAEQVGATL